MKIGLVIVLNPTPPTAPLLFAGRLDQGLAAAARLGCEGVELNILDPDEVDGPALARRINAHGLEVCSIATGQAYGKHGLSLSSAEPDLRRRAAERLQNHALLASLLGSAVTVGLIRGMLPWEEPGRGEGRKRILEGVAAFARFAGSLGVPVYLEPLNRYECNNLNTVAETLAAMHETGAGNLYLLADTFHMNIEDADMAGSLRLAGRRTGYVHLADSNRQAPGAGHTDFQPILGALRSSGYQGYLSAEILPLPDDETAAERFVRFCRESM